MPAKKQTAAPPPRRQSFAPLSPKPTFTDLYDFRKYSASIGADRLPDTHSLCRSSTIATGFGIARIFFWLGRRLDIPEISHATHYIFDDSTSALSRNQTGCNPSQAALSPSFPHLSAWTPIDFTAITLDDSRCMLHFDTWKGTFFLLTTCIY